jgi:hypothetical protein
LFLRMGVIPRRTPSFPETQAGKSLVVFQARSHEDGEDTKTEWVMHDNSPPFITGYYT